jgi:hypothetical protein
MKRFLLLTLILVMESDREAGVTIVRAFSSTWMLFRLSIPASRVPGAVRIALSSGEKAPAVTIEAFGTG